MTKQVHIHIHRTKARDAGEGEGKWITLSPSGTHVKIDKGGEITAGPKGMTGKKPSELSKGASESPKPIKHATGQGQSFLPTQPKMGHGTVTKTGSGFTAKNHKGFKEYFKPHEEEKAKAYAASGKEDTPLKGSAGPATTKTESYSWGKLTKVGNVNESAIAHPKDREQIAALADGDSYQYTDEQGKQWKVTRHGEQAAFYKANAAKPALVAPIGEFQDTSHDPTGMAHAGRPQGTAAVQARIDAKKAAGNPVGFAGKASAPDLTKHSQFTKADYDYLKEKGWSDPEIKKRWDEEAAQGRPPQQANKLKPPSAFGPASGEGPRGASRAGSATTKTAWSKSNGDWTTAKKEGAAMFERAMSSAKTGGDRTDAALKLKAEAAEQQKNGSYLGAVVLGLVNDYFDRLK